VFYDGTPGSKGEEQLTEDLQTLYGDVNAGNVEADVGAGNCSSALRACFDRGIFGDLEATARADNDLGLYAADPNLWARLQADGGLSNIHRNNWWYDNYGIDSYYRAPDGRLYPTDEITLARAGEIMARQPSGTFGAISVAARDGSGRHVLGVVVYNGRVYLMNPVRTLADVKDPVLITPEAVARTWDTSKVTLLFQQHPANGAPASRYTPVEGVPATATADLDQAVGATLPAGPMRGAVRWGNGQSKTFTDRVNIGRSPDNDIVLTDPKVSRSHAVILRTGENTYRVMDLGSPNGIWVNGVRVPSLKGQDLWPGDRLQIGPNETLIFQLEEAPVVLRDQNGQTFSIRRPLRIGRNPDNDIVVTDREASRVHALIEQGDDGRYYVQDLGSRNGTFVNGTRLEGAERIPIGLQDRVQVADRTFRLGGDAAPVTPSLRDASGKAIRVTQRLNVGRVPDNDIVIDDQKVSRHHALIQQNPQGDYIIEDLQSRNGTKVNGVRLAPLTPTRLTDGDVIEVFNHRLVFEQPEPAAPASSRNDLLDQIGEPSAVQTWREREVPYRTPRGMMIAQAGSPIDFKKLDLKQRYLWVVDPEGRFLLAPESQPGHFARRNIAKHGDLVAGAGSYERLPARGGGEFYAEEDRLGQRTGRWILDNKSSYTFNRSDKRWLNGASLNAVQSLLETTGTDTKKIVLLNNAGVDRVQ
jgi:pSer/pThr/pTyr-binding forkhead associated (FHA) protein